MLEFIKKALLLIEQKNYKSALMNLKTYLLNYPFSNLAVKSEINVCLFSISRQSNSKEQ